MFCSFELINILFYFMRHIERMMVNYSKQDVLLIKCVEKEKLSRLLASYARKIKQLPSSVRFAHVYLINLNILWCVAWIKNHLSIEYRSKRYCMLVMKPFHRAVECEHFFMKPPITIMETGKFPLKSLCLSSVHPIFIRIKVKWKI